MPTNNGPLYETVERHERDLYRGNGKPGITTRLQTLEDDVKDILEAIKERETAHNTKMNIILAAVITGLAGMLLAHLKII